MNKDMGKRKATTKKPSFAQLSKKLEKEPRLLGDNFRKRAERVGCPPDKVRDFKYWIQDHGK